MSLRNLGVSERRKGIVLIGGCFQTFHLLGFVVSVIFVAPRNILEIVVFKQGLFSNFHLVVLVVSAQWARRDILMSQDKSCCETVFVSQLSRNYPHRGGNFERGKMSLLRARDSLGGTLGDNLGEGNCESKVSARQWRGNFCHKALRCLSRLKTHFLLQNPWTPQGFLKGSLKGF